MRKLKSFKENLKEWNKSFLGDNWVMKDNISRQLDLHQESPSIIQFLQFFHLFVLNFWTSFITVYHMRSIILAFHLVFESKTPNFVARRQQEIQSNEGLVP